MPPAPSTSGYHLVGRAHLGLSRFARRATSRATAFVALLALTNTPAHAIVMLPSTTTWPNNMIGYGRIDVFAAYQKAISSPLDLSNDD